MLHNDSYDSAADVAGIQKVYAHFPENNPVPDLEKSFPTFPEGEFNLSYVL
jgi:hypothetical protein